ncbi:hypothetical protein ACOZDF_32065 [Streptomyces griseoincarnatus]
MSWAIKVTDEYAEWFRLLIKEDLSSASQVAQAVAALREAGPTLDVVASWEVVYGLPPDPGVCPGVGVRVRI